MLCDRHGLYANDPVGPGAPGVSPDPGLHPRANPCVATLHLVFSRLDKAAFEAALKDGALEGPGDGGEEETTHAVTSLGQLKPMPRGCKRSGGVIGEPRTETTTYKMSP